jgi:hypothetical protein
MQNNVVSALEQGFFRAGFSTLKFNFRGVGGSSGEYDEGAGEVRDVAAAYRFLQESGIRDVILAGYSFGAWICSKTSFLIESRPELFLVAYPFAFYGTEELRDFSGRIYLIGGSLDDISPLENLLAFYKDLKAEKYLKVLPTSHFFEGMEKEITGFIAETFAVKAE